MRGQRYSYRSGNLYTINMHPYFDKKHGSTLKVKSDKSEVLIWNWDNCYGKEIPETVTSLTLKSCGGQDDYHIHRKKKDTRMGNSI